MSKTNYFEIIKENSDRVFQIDRECYLLYLGSTFFEKAPYLLIGSSPEIPPVFKKQIGFIVLTGSAFGSVYELEQCLTKGHFPCLIGTDDLFDTFFSVINTGKFPEEKFKKIFVKYSRKAQSFTTELQFEQYLNSLQKTVKNTDVAEDKNKTKFKHAPSEKAVDISRKITVTFNRKGNLFIMIDGETIFDLKLRASDGLTNNNFFDHLISRFIYRNRHFFRGSGFIMLDTELAYYDYNRVFLSGLPSDYFRELIKGNVDPDNITYLFSNKGKSNFENFIKRQIVTGGTAKIFTEKFSALKPVIDFYKPIDIKTENVTQNKIDFSTTSVQLKTENRQVQIYNIDAETYIDYFYGKHGKTKLESDINIIPAAMSSRIKTAQGMINLVYEKGSNRFNSKFKGSPDLYKMFPYIDYRINKLYKFEQRVYYALDIYVKDILYDYPRSIRRCFVNFSRQVYDLLDFYIQRDPAFKKTLKKVLTFSRYLLPPNNRYEYFILHNTTEFLCYLDDLLKARAVLRLKIVDKIINDLQQLRNHGANVEVSDMNYKGDITVFPNERLYLFYTTVDALDDEALPRQHERLLQKNIETGPAVIQNDNQRLNRQITKFSNVKGNRHLVSRWQEEGREAADYLLADQQYFSEELYRLHNINNFCNFFRNLPAAEQKKFCFMIKTVQGGLNEFEKDEQLFGDLLEDFSFKSVKKIKFKTGTGLFKNRFKFAISSVIMIFLLMLSFINISSLTFSKPVKKFRQHIITNNIGRVFFIKPYFRKLISRYSYLYKEELPEITPLYYLKDINTNGNRITTNLVVNDKLFNRTLYISYEDFNRHFRDVLKLNTFADEDLIYPGDLVQINDAAYYKIKELDTLWGITFRKLYDKQKEILAELARIELVIIYYEKVIKEKTANTKLMHYKRKLDIINKKIKTISDLTDIRQVKNYAEKLQCKIIQINKLLENKELNDGCKR